jgi:hypothetical protein
MFTSPVYIVKLAQLGMLPDIKPTSLHLLHSKLSDESLWSVESNLQESEEASEFPFT